MGLNTALAILVALVFGLIGMVLAKPWEVPINKNQKWIRSLYVGLFTSLGVFFSLITLGWQKSQPKAIFDQLLAFGSIYLCFGLPVGFISTIGFYFSYKQLGWLLKQKRKIKKR